MREFVVLSSLPFLFRFLPAFLVVYYLVPARFRDAVLFAASIVFYAAGEPEFVFLLLGLTIFNYMAGSLVYTERKVRRSRQVTKPLFAGIVACDALVLVLCKVLALTIDSSLLPLGMSFYIFKMISYQADLCFGKRDLAPTFLRTADYFMMFPQVTEGPIMRYGDGFAAPRSVSLDQFEEGLFYVVTGFGMKVLLADRIGILWNEITKIGYDSISTPLAWLGAYAYTFQLYFDFWGYSLIAAGVGVMLGFPFIENFAHPYASRSIGEFYRRWHATLGAWFKDYIYIPLGGSRRGTKRTIFNLMLVWLITGLWHGGTLNFVIWGLVLGLIICLEKFPLKGAMKVLGRINVLVVIPLTWVIFAISDLQSLRLYFTRLFPFFGIGQTANASDVRDALMRYGILFLAGAALCVPKVFDTLKEHRRNPLVVLLCCAVFVAGLYFAANSQGNTFLYFDF